MPFISCRTLLAVWALGSGGRWPGTARVFIPGAHLKAQRPFCGSHQSPLVSLAPVKAAGLDQQLVPAFGWVLSGQGCRL